MRTHVSLGSYLLLLRLLLWFVRWAEPLRFSSNGTVIAPANLPSRRRATQLQHSSDQRLSESSRLTNCGRHYLIARSWRSLLCEAFCPALTTLARHDDNRVREQTVYKALYQFADYRPTEYMPSIWVSNMVCWCSWLSRVTHTDKVAGSNPA